jgi:hypothetical protein
MSVMPPPVGAPSQTPPPAPDAMSRVNGPAIGLMAAGGLMVAGNLLGLLLNILGVGAGAMGGGDQAIANMMSGTVGIISNLLGTALGVVVLLGALKMRQLQSYSFAMASAIIAMLPCSCCCVIGLPIGIWGLVVLLKPEIKSAFTG